MMLSRTLVALSIVVACCAALSAPPSISAMRWHQRVLLVSAADPNDPKLARQRSILSAWQQGATDRDVVLVQISGMQVLGASDTADALRKRYSLDPAAFQAVLIGKDGQVAMRSAEPFDADKLQGTIDAMPMRQAGER